MQFDLIVIGGGINGAGIARDAALRGLRTCLVEQADLCNSTTRWSSRLIHGGLRYLEFGELGLVHESLQERTRLLRNAAHLVRPLQLFIPVYAHSRRGINTVDFGLWVYDLLSVGGVLPGHRRLSREAAIAELPALNREGLDGGILYHDAQVTFVERLVVENALAASAAGAMHPHVHHRRAHRAGGQPGAGCGGARQPHRAAGNPHGARCRQRCRPLGGSCPGGCRLRHAPIHGPDQGHAYRGAPI